MVTLGWRTGLGALVCSLLAAAASCSGDDDGGGSGASGGGAGSDGGDAATCPTAAEAFAPGGDGHADPFGAKAAKQARAGKLTDAGMLVQPAHGRQQIEVGDFVLANDKIAVTIEAPGLSDGYDRFGGKVVAVDAVGGDGKPLGKSRFVETLLALSIETVDAKSVSVINDGSDGQAAVVRASGPLTAIPFLDGSLGALFPRRYGLEAAFEYVLEPGSDKLLVRLGVLNPGEEEVKFAVGKVSDEMHGFFHYSQNQLAAPGFGFGNPIGGIDWAGFVAPDDWSFAWRPASGEKLDYGLEVSGFVYTLGPGFSAAPCSVTWTDHVEIIGGGPDLDGLAEAVRRVDGAEPWVAVTGAVEDASGAPVADAWVHLLSTDDAYLSRARADGSGAFTIHAPPGQATKLVAQSRGYPNAETALAAGAQSATLTFAPVGKIHVTATELSSGAALPVRVQVMPKDPLPATPAAFGVEDAAGGRLHQEYVMSGDVTLAVPPGEHRVVVSRGYEYEIVDQTLVVNAGQTVDLPAVLERSVDTTGFMCADFHIHSFLSVDSNDSVDAKVRSAIADGLEIPVSSEHEWVIDFQPVVEQLGMQSWAFGMPSEELTTFTWGHFGVVPLLPRPGEVNNGAIDWVGKMPADVFGMVQALPEDPVLIVNHPSGGDFGSYFSQSGFDHETGTGNKPDLWSENFDAVEVFNSSSLDENRTGSVRDWFGLLNAGKTAWAVGSSDSHHIRTSPVGYPRTCMDLGGDDPAALSANQVRDALASGKLTISGGLYMTVSGPGGVGPGETVSGAGASEDFTVTVQAPSWVDATTLEVIVNGETVATEPLAPFGSGTAKSFVNSVSIPVDASKARNWVVFHAKGDAPLDPVHPGRDPFAVSSPIFLVP